MDAEAVWIGRGSCRAEKFRFFTGAPPAYLLRSDSVEELWMWLRPLLGRRWTCDCKRGKECVGLLLAESAHGTASHLLVAAHLVLRSAVHQIVAHIVFWSKAWCTLNVLIGLLQI